MSAKFPKKRVGATPDPSAVFVAAKPITAKPETAPAASLSAAFGNALGAKASLAHLPASPAKRGNDLARQAHGSKADGKTARPANRVSPGIPRQGHK